MPSSPLRERSTRDTGILNPLSEVAPVFVVGSQRSGTTMFRLMLDSHPRISIPFETNFIQKLAWELDRSADCSDDDALGALLTKIQEQPFVKRGDLSAITLDEVGRHIRARSLAGVVDALFTAHAARQGKTIWGDKSPGLDVKPLQRLFPNAIVIHLIRDGRDCAVSRRRKWGERSIAKLAHIWHYHVNSIREAAIFSGDRYHEVFYEDLVLEPKRTLEEVCRWIGVDFDPLMLRYHEDARRRMPEASVRLHHGTSVQPPTKSKVAMHKSEMSNADRLVFERIAGSLLAACGYEIKQNLSFLDKVRLRLNEIRYAMVGETIFRAPGAQVVPANPPATPPPDSINRS